MSTFLRSVAFVFCVIALGMLPGQLCAKVVRVEVSDVGTAWAGHPLGFALLTDGDEQYVAYYSGTRQMMVASRPTTGGTWTQQGLPQTVGWDSHNYVTLGIDSNRQLHVSGNMHVDPLVYYRTQTAGDISTLGVAPMVGSQESQVTYPRFFNGPSGDLIYTYRQGASGNGVNYYNTYDAATQSWSRLLSEPLLNGLGAVNAYQDGPNLGPDGKYHMAWVWRATAAAETTYSVEYARSTDLVNWEAVDGTTITPPITPDPSTLPAWAGTDPTPDNAPNVIVDPVPQMNGLINGSQHVGFDDQSRAVISYHKFDAAGNTQIYNARFENNQWVSHQVTNWNYRWDFSGQGTLQSEITLSEVKTDFNGNLVQDFSHIVFGSGRWTLDPVTLQPISQQSGPFDGLEHNAFSAVQGNFSGLGVRWTTDLGSSGDPNIKYRLRWETLAGNNDQPRTPPLPNASSLQVYKFDYNTGTPLGGADPVRVQTLAAVEDAYVQLSSPSTNFGSSTGMSLKFEDSSGLSRKIYLKFDISGFDSDLREAALVMDLTARTPGDYALSTRTFVLNPGLGDSWDEATLNWNNAPAGAGVSGDSLDPTMSSQIDMFAALTSDVDQGSSLAGPTGFVFASGQSLVDAIISAQSAGDNFISLVITRADDSGNNMVWAALEDASALGPRLLFVSRNAADFTDDGLVNNDDLTTWQNGFGVINGAGFIDGDADKDGKVDGSDFLNWQTNYGDGVISLAASYAVPEPTSIVLFSVGMVAILTRCFDQ